MQKHDLIVNERNEIMTNLLDKILYPLECEVRTIFAWQDCCNELSCFMELRHCPAKTPSTFCQRHRDYFNSCDELVITIGQRKVTNLRLEKLTNSCDIMTRHFGATLVDVNGCPDKKGAANLNSMNYNHYYFDKNKIIIDESYEKNRFFFVEIFVL